MKFLNKFALVIAAAMTLACVTVKAQSLDTFANLRILPMSTNIQIAANAGLTTNGPFDMGGYVGRGTLIAWGEIPSVAPAGTLAFKLESSPDTTNWFAISNFATITATTPVVYTNLGVVYNQTVFTSTNFVNTNYFLLPYTATYPSAPYGGYNTPYPAPNQFTNAAGNTTVAANGTPAAWSVNAQDQQRYWHIIWTGTGGATNGINPSNAVVNATWFCNRINAP